MCCCAPFVGHIPPMSLQNPKFPSKLNRTEMADEAELFCTSASKTVVFARLLVSVNDLHRGLSSSVFRVEQITQNPLMATSCGFDPRHRHHTEIPNFLEMRGLGFFILSVSINISGAEKFLENKIHECEKGAVGMICPNTGHPVLGVYPYEKPNCAFFWF